MTDPRPEPTDPPDTAGLAESGDTVQRHIESLLLGGGRRYTRAEVAAKAGIPLERARTLWRALGFSAVPDDAVVFTDGDVHALRITNELILGGIVEPSIATSSARMIGQHMSRLAESQVLTMRDIVRANPELAADQRQLTRFIEHLAPAMEQLQDFVWRRHLIAHSVRTLLAPDEDPDSRREVVGFADMVGFTSLTRRSTEADLVDVVDRFETVVTDVLADAHGRVVKMLGDEVLFVADTAEQGAEAALALLERAERTDGIPPLRAGLAFGRVLSRFGDVYGPVVNIASRLTSIARPGTVLIDRELAAALADDPAYAIRHRRPVSVRGYARLRSASLRRAGEHTPSIASSVQRAAADLLGLGSDEPDEPDDTDEPEQPHIPLVPDETSAKRSGRTRPGRSRRHR